MDHTIFKCLLLLFTNIYYVYSDMTTPTTVEEAMSSKRAPFNVSLLQLDRGQLRILDPITVLDIFDSPNSSEFHDQGLFSTEIFGRIGEPQRDRTFAYIPLKTQIIHPFVYSRLEKVRKFYIKILRGEQNAIWDEQKQDFVEPKGDQEGDTGFAFFMSHWHELSIPEGQSELRQKRVELINRFRDRATLENILILPAGLRDAEVDSEGRVQEDEINEYYRKLIGISKSVTQTIDTQDPSFDSARVAQQNTFNTIFNHLEGMLSKKKGFIQQKWGKRNIVNGTRNVITAMNVSPAHMDDDNHPQIDDTAIGLWQLSRGAQPVTIHSLREFIIDDAFGSSSGSAFLIHPDTYQRTQVKVQPQTFDRWNTSEGLEKVIDQQSILEIRDHPVTIEGYYLALVYKPQDEMVFKVFTDIEELPDGFDRDHVYPITWMELIYLCNYQNWNQLACTVTRYPVTEESSTYVSKVYVRTTSESQKRVELTNDWSIPEDPKQYTALEYPVFEQGSYIDSTMVHVAKLAGLGGDKSFVRL